MVFESLVVELVNKYLGDFIENLDTSQLKIGIWGGDVVLNNLFIKQSALDDLDLPVKVLHGNIGKLVLKVPWKNLYTEPTIATLEGLYVVAVPNSGIKYEDEKEKKTSWEAKQKELQRIDDAKKAAADKNKPSDPKADSFAEKLATNVIKNLQVHVRDVHIRYEDKFSNPAKPYALGVTLKGLLFQTTDEKWMPTTIKDAVAMIHKLVQLDSLAMYWNTKAQIYTDFNRDRLQAMMQKNIADPQTGTDYCYMVEPISSSAKLRLNTKPENDKFTIPKVLLNVLFEQIGIALTKGQFQNIMEVLESFERMNLSSKYRKYQRPVQPIKGRSKEWWRYAYRAVMGETVQRRRQMFSWQHILHHRNLCKEYKNVYKKKLGLKKIPADLTKQLETLEKELTVFNITLNRQQAELEVIWERQRRVAQPHRRVAQPHVWDLYLMSAALSIPLCVMTYMLMPIQSVSRAIGLPLDEAKKEGIKKQKSGGGGWLSGWWGGGKKATEQEEEKIGDQFQKLMSDDEKAKLYQALGYEESVGDPTLPTEYVANELNFKLNAISITLKDDERKLELVKVSVNDTTAKLVQRPAANAVGVNAKMDSFTVIGAPAIDGSNPLMVSSQNKEANLTYSLLDLMFETNPLDGECDVRVKLNTRPLEIIYDANTINQIAEFFKPPESVHLAQIQSAAMAKFEELKEQTATGLQHTIEQRKYTEIAVDLKPTYVLIPEKGVYRKDAQMLVLDLGSLKVKSKKQERTATTPTDGAPLSKEEIMQKAYDQFDITLAHFQLLYAGRGAEWQAARQLDNSPLHILKPMGLTVSLFKSFLEDVSLPKMKIRGVLPSLNIGISDKRLEEVLCLVNSIPFPEGAPAPPEEELAIPSAPNIAETIAQEGSASQLVKKFVVEDSSSDEEGQPKPKKAPLQKQTSKEYVNMTDVDLQFEIKEICVNLSQRQNDQDIPLIKLVIDSLGTSVKVRTFDLQVTAYLGGIYVQHMQFKASPEVAKFYSSETALHEGPLINLVNTPVTDDTTFKLLTVTYLKANKKGPEFKTVYKNTEQSIDVHFSALEVLLHQEAIVNILEFAQNLQAALAASSPSKTDTTPNVDTMSVPSKIRRTSSALFLGTTPTSSSSSMSKIRRARMMKEEETIDIAVKASLDVFAVAVCNQKNLITDVKIKGLEANIGVLKSKTTISASLKDITVYDPASDALYPKILTFEGGEVFSMNIIAFNGATEGDNYSNMACVDTSILLITGCMKIVFLNKFVNSLLKFLQQFQTAMDKAKEKGLAAAESAANAAKDFSAKASRVKLDVKLKAPVVVIPQNSKSGNTVVADLGNISVSNTFSMPGKYSPDKVPAVLDKMVVELSSLKLSRALMMGTDMRAECVILDPVNIKLGVTRNLAAGWYHGHPDVDIYGNLDNFSVAMSQGDYTTIMSILTENLQEGQDEVQKIPSDASQPSKQDIEVPTESTITAEVAGTVASSAHDVAGTGAKKDVAEVHSTLEFNFSIQSIRAELFTGDSNLDSGQTQRDAKLSLALFELQQIGAEGKMLSNSSIKAKVSLHRIVLQDTRPGKEKGITKMVQQSTLGTSDASGQHMINVDFTQLANLNKDLKTEVKGLYICVCLEYLMAVGDFFTKGLPQAKPVPPTPSTAIEPTVSKTSATGTQSAPAVMAQETKQSTAPPAATGDINILLTVDNPEIILVENAMDPNTNALILETAVLFKMRISPESQTMSGTVAKLQIMSCIFAEEKREASKCLILKPTDISLNLNAPQGKGHHIAIMVGDIVMTISPAIIRTVTATLGALSKPAEEEEENKASKVPKNLWDVKNLKDCDNLWYTKPDEVADEAKEESTESAVSLLEEEETDEETESRGEQLMMQVKRITVTLEGGIGRRTIPLIITEMTFHAEVKDWSSRLRVSADTALEIAYYNENLAVWEPLIEPVEDESRLRPWEISLEVLQNELLPPPPPEGEDEADGGVVMPSPKMTINVLSKDILQVTISKTCLDVLTKLGKSFNDAYNLVEQQEKVDEVLAPYTISNETGRALLVDLDNTLKMPSNAVDGRVELHSEDKLHLYNTEAVQKMLAEKSVIKSTQQELRKKISVTLADFGIKKELKIMKAENKAFSLQHKSLGTDPWHMICQTDASYGSKTVNLRSIVQITNHLPFPMELYYKMSDDATGRCGEVPSGGVFSIPLDAVYSKPHEIYFKPRDANYAESGHSFKWKDYKEPKDALEKVVSCLPSKDPDLPPVCFYLKTETEDVIVDGTDDKKVTSYMVNLYPCVTFRNLLPLPLHYKLPGSSEYSVMEAGNKATFVNAMPGETKIDFKIEKYLEKDWTGSKLIEENPQDLSVLGFESELGSVIDLGIHCNKQHGYQELSLYCPYWMVNKTGRDLSYKAGDDFAMLHPGDKQGIVLFSFRSKSFFGKKKDEHDTASICSSNSTNSASPSKKKRKLRSPFKKKAVPLKTDNSVSLQKAVKASLKVSDSDWSDKFSLDTVGSSGTVTCKLKGKTYEEESPSKKSPKKAPTLSSKNIGRTLTTAAQIGASVGSPPKEHRSKPNSKRSPVKIKVGVNIQLSSSGLTKIVTFTPYFMLINQATYPICCKEVDITEEQWWEVGPGDCLPFWPMQTDKIKQMVVKVKDTTEESLPFCFTDAHTTLLKLSNEHGGVNVVCDCQESAVEIMLQEYKPGYASVRLVNMLTNSAVEYIQGGMKDAKPVALQPDQTVLYTWENPKGKRELLWTCGDKKQQKNDLLKDHIDSFYYNSDTKWYWVSFLDGMQRVLLFTEDFVIATLALQAGELERLDQEINLSLQGMGLSLVNNLIQKEVAYMGITSSGVIWEEKKKKRFKALKVKQSAIIEAAYEKFVAEISVGKNPATHMKLEQKLEIDFGNNPPMMIKPRKCAIKRSYENGIWLQYRTSAHQLQFHMKIHRLQLDNQLPGAVFPTVLAPIPPPKSVAADSVPKPFTEMSIMIRKKEYSPVMQFKYFKVLTQEMSVKVDQGFLNALILLFASEEADEESKRAMFKQDMAVIDKKLLEYAVQSSADEQKHFYDMLHVSPLKVHLSFSLYGAEKDKDKPMQLQSDVLNLFLQSVGIVLTDVQDVVFKLGYFERKFQFYNQSQLTSEVVHHYSSQAIKQMYVLVLGLDVLGNPFGVIRGLAEGIEDLFYEPYQGAVQGPEEFAEGLALGVRSLLGHAVGGAAGAVSRITGALGKGIATLTLDDDYQKKRREQLNKRPADFKEGLARGGKGLVMGVFDGVTGIVRKPVEGAKEEGVAGFFKGVGKGLVGVVTRPTSGVVDFASGTFEGVKRVAEMSDEVRRLRPPRFLHKDGIVRPYVHKEAEGNDTLQDVEKGKYALTDTYIGHVVITKDLKNVLVVTDKRILFASKGEIFGHWDCDWQYSWEELKEPPTLTNKGIQILLKEKEKKSFFKSGTMGKVIPMEDRQTAAWLVKKMHEIMQQSK